MRPHARTGLLILLLLFLPASSWAVELEQGVNWAGIIAFPTAHNQPDTHILHGTLELTDLSDTDLNLYNLRYGYQFRTFQLLADFQFALEPAHEFDYAEVKGKIQLLYLEEFRIALAMGLLGRGVKHSDEREARIDDKTASLFGIFTVELFPFDRWGAFLVNFYLDNRFFVLGLKTQLYESVQFVLEGDYLHATEREENTSFRTGVSIGGQEGIYFQLLYTNVGENFLIQSGVGF